MFGGSAGAAGRFGMWEGGREKWAGGSRWEGGAEFGTSGPEGHKGFEGFSQTADRASGEKKHVVTVHYCICCRLQPGG